MADHVNQNGYNNHKESQVAVVMVPLPAQGHLNQLLHLSRLLSAANLPVYYVGAATHVRQAKVRVHGWDPSATAAINFHELPVPPFENPLPDPHSSIKFPVQFLPSLHATLSLREPVFNFVNELSKNFRRVIVIYDGNMAYVVQDIGTIRNSESYCFRSISAFSYFSFRWEAAGRPDLHLPDEAKILEELPSPDGFFAPEFVDFSNLQRESNKNFSGDIYNTSRVIEASYLDLLAKEKTTGTDKVWAIGPFNPVLFLEKKSHICLDWLEKQPENSVIFVSFGTTSSFSDEQVKELAYGLEKSEQKFIWVLRDADKPDIFRGDVRKVELPKGFEERVKERGIIVRDWAPQLEILSHSATGGFISHCGWNSCIESISMGVPIATWPMHSDQPNNAVLVTKVLKTGLEVKDWARRDEVVSANAVESAVRRLMASEEGDKIRRRAKELGVKVKNSVMKGGSSHVEMDSFISHITR